MSNSNEDITPEAKLNNRRQIFGNLHFVVCCTFIVTKFMKIYIEANKIILGRESVIRWQSLAGLTKS